MQNKLLKLEKYFETESYDDFYAIGKDLVFWVDWREYDDAIVDFIEECLETGSLAAKIEDRPNEELELFVSYQGKIHQRIIVDLDDTIIWLNELLQPTYEIRFCKVSKGSDTLAFVPLTNEQWQALQGRYGEELISKHFEVITKNSKFFNKKHKKTALNF